MRSFLVLACIGLASANPAAAQEPVPEPLTLNAALDEALQRNPDLIALRREYEAALAIPAAERFLAPPSFEAQIWAWPVTTLNPIRTDMYHAVVPAGSEQDLRLAASIPVGRIGEAGDVARAVAFFAAPANGFVTGQTLFVCGGSSVSSLKV